MECEDLVGEAAELEALHHRKTNVSAAAVMLEMLVSSRLARRGGYAMAEGMSSAVNATLEVLNENLMLKTASGVSLDFSSCLLFLIEA